MAVPKLDVDDLNLKRCSTLRSWLLCYKEELGVRLAESRTLFGTRCLAVDIHSHSVHSDGRATVQDNVEMARVVGLDFLFATDHNSLAQKRHTRKWPDTSWGQEPGAGPHHIGLLCGRQRFRPKGRSIAADFAAAARISPFVWIPHPAGWHPKTWYTDEAIDTLWTLGPEFAVEVLNGAHKIVTAYDRFDAKAVRVWDRLLCDGRKVTALGASDAHVPEAIGTAWTGVFAVRRNAASIIRALRAGRCFASESSLLDFSCNGQPMGSAVQRRRGSDDTLRIRVADAGGLAWVRVVAGGKTIKQYDLHGTKLFDARLVHRAAQAGYYRIESAAIDDRRAFSTPIYVTLRG